MSISCQLLFGKTILTPLPASVLQAISQIEIVHDDENPGGFQILFNNMRAPGAAKIDYPLLELEQLKPFNRVRIQLLINTITYKLMDGFITHTELQPDINHNEPGVYAITGQDIMIALDKETRIHTYLLLSDAAIVALILKDYRYLDLTPEIIPADQNMDTFNFRGQCKTDLAFLRELAKRYGYEFYITSDALTGSNIAYWGPPKRLGKMQQALSVNMGTSTNVSSIKFTYNALDPILYESGVLDSKLNEILPITTHRSLETPLSMGALTENLNRKRFLRGISGGNFLQALDIAQAQTDVSMRQVLQAVGELDVTRYNGILQARRLVGLRGVGVSYDGQYYVKRVTQLIKPGSYRQQFHLVRDGLGSNVPGVIP